MSEEIKIPELGYWDTAIDESILLKEVLPYLDEESKLILKKFDNYILETSILFEKIRNSKDGMVDSEYTVVYTPEGTREYVESSNHSFIISFEKKEFRLDTNMFAKKWIEDMDFRQSSMLELQMTKSEELKNNFLLKQKNGLTKYEIGLHHIAESNICHSVEFLITEELIDQIADAYEKICVERTEQKQNTIGLKMKEFKVI